MGNSESGEVKEPSTSRSQPTVSRQSSRLETVHTVSVPPVRRPAPNSLPLGRPAPKPPPLRARNEIVSVDQSSGIWSSSQLPSQYSVQTQPITDGRVGSTAVVYRPKSIPSPAFTSSVGGTKNTGSVLVKRNAYTVGNVNQKNDMSGNKTQGHLNPPIPSTHSPSLQPAHTVQQIQHHPGHVKLKQRDYQLSTAGRLSNSSAELSQKATLLSGSARITAATCSLIQNNSPVDTVQNLGMYSKQSTKDKAYIKTRPIPSTSKSISSQEKLNASELLKKSVAHAESFDKPDLSSDSRKQSVSRVSPYESGISAFSPFKSKPSRDVPGKGIDKNQDLIDLSDSTASHSMQKKNVKPKSCLVDHGTVQNRRANELMISEHSGSSENFFEFVATRQLPDEQVTGLNENNTGFIGGNTISQSSWESDIQFSPRSGPLNLYSKKHEKTQFSSMASTSRSPVQRGGTPDYDSIKPKRPPLLPTPSTSESDCTFQPANKVGSAFSNCNVGPGMLDGFKSGTTNLKHIQGISAKCSFDVEDKLSQEKHIALPVTRTPSTQQENPKKRSRNRRRNRPRPHQRSDHRWWSKKKSKVPPEQCLIHFSRGPAMESSDSETDSISAISHGSSVYKQDSFTDDEDDNSVFSIESQSESIGSHLSRAGSTYNLDNTASLGTTKQCFIDEKYFVAVYWVLEDCPVPSGGSAMSIIKKIRNQFCRGYNEVTFAVICDLSRNSVVSEELSGCDVSIMHASSSTSRFNKLSSLVSKYFSNYMFKQGSVILLTEVSTAASVLNKFQYKKNISVTVIFDNHSVHSPSNLLQNRANLFIAYSEFISDLILTEWEDFLYISGAPSGAEWRFMRKAIRNRIGQDKVVITKLSQSSAEIVFPDENSCTRAFKALQGFIFDRKLLKVELGKRKKKQEEKCDRNSYVDSVQNQNFHGPKVDPPASSKKHSRQPVTNPVLSVGFPSSSGNVCEQEYIENNNVSTSSVKKASLYIMVSYRFGDVPYWGSQFEKLFQNGNLSVFWSDSCFDGCFIVKFNSLSKAQKARKVLENLQKKDVAAPKFFKLVKESESFDLASFSPQRSFLEFGGRTEESPVWQYLKQIDVKCRSYLLEHEKKIEEAMSCDKTAKRGFKVDDDVASVLHSKIRELKEMEDTFNNYTDMIRGKLRQINTSTEDYQQLADDLLIDYSRECCCFQNALPVYAKKRAVLETVRKHQVVVIQAETGSGKSTQICQYLWKDGLAEDGIIVCTQPRKIAAMSLAKHVSSQIGCCLGTIVGYKVGLSRRKCDETKILYVTDFTLLKMCTENPTFDGISCVVVDEAHERTIYTDLLLGMLKRCLESRQDLKVIITSATIKMNLFQKYFSLAGSAVMKISGRSFPIEDIWLNENVEVGWNYFDKTIDTAIDILKEGPGDVLAFLPTPAETEKAVNIFNEKAKRNNLTARLLVYCLHGKLDIKEQQKIFDRTPAKCRKIVFSTNCAETSVTIPGIKYVIDCGMVKEAKYDPSRNLNILAIGFVNKSSAEQRRGRAGRIESGRCYRLYSRSNYEKDMADQMVPEILRVNLGQALLKLMAAGIRQPLQFDFVESPSKHSLLTAMSQLVHLGAVSKDRSLITAIGKQMAVLPLEPRLAHVILKGIGAGFGYEAVILSALATVSRSIFFRNEENKNIADLRKIRFCVSESDFLTYLEVYKEWLAAPKKEKSRWCSVNCINAKSMRLAHELVTEILQTLSKELGVNIGTKIVDDSNAFGALHKIIFRSFAENLCIYGGHDKIGYLSSVVSERLQIHPSSALCSLAKWRPQFIVYDSILKTSQTFLINVTVATESMIEDALNDDILPVDPYYLRSLTPHACVFYGLGVSVLKTFLGNKGEKLKKLESDLQNFTGSDLCAISADFESGQLTVYVPQNYRAIVDSMFEPMIREAKEKIRDYELEITDFANVESLSAVLGSGIEVKQVILAGEYRSVRVNLRNCDFDSVLPLLKKYGEVVNVKKCKNHQKVVFRNVDDAHKAVHNLQANERFTVVPDIASWSSKRPLSSFMLIIHLLRRPCSGLAFFNVKPETSFPEACFKILNRSISFIPSSGGLSFSLPVCVSKKNPKDFCITKVPGNVTEQDLKSTLSKFLPIGVSVNKLVIVRSKEFQSDKLEVESIRAQVVSFLSQFTPERELDVKIKTPNNKDIEWRIMASFSKFHDGQKAYNFLKNTHSFFGKTVVKFKPVVETTLYCHSEVFAVIKCQVEEALKFFNSSITSDEETLTVDAITENQRVRIFINSNSINNIFDASRCIRTLIEGYKIDCSGNPFLQKLFTSRGKEFLRKLKSKVPDGHLNLNGYTKVISMYGSELALTLLKGEVNKYLDSLANIDSEEISLESSSKGIVKEIVKRFGTDLVKLAETCGLSIAKINVHQKVLFVSGEAAGIAQCKELISQICTELAADDDSYTSSGSAETCPVCLEDIVPPAYRLEYCGHAYCEMCVLLQLENTDILPVSCCKEGCNELFVLNDLKWAASKRKSMEKKIHSKALENYVKKNNNTVKFCPSPDCQMLYRVTNKPDQSEYTCPSCNNSICRKCCVLYHSGMTCQFYQMYNNVDDRVLTNWMLEDPSNRKLCPSCKAPIEKNGGCLHVTCFKCQCHMCWWCLKQFPTGNEVYDHQPRCTAQR